MIPFNKPYLTGQEAHRISEAHKLGQLAGDGYFTSQCSKWLEQNIGANRALLTHSCTAALEMAAILINIQPGDEIIMPSYTFVSSANAFVLSRPFLTSSIIGATSLEQLDENIRSINIKFTDEMMRDVQNIHLSDPNPCY